MAYSNDGLFTFSRRSHKAFTFGFTLYCINNYFALLQDEWKADSDESDDSGEDSSDVEAESGPAHKETVTVPTTTVATNTTRALPLEAFGLQPDVTTPRRVEPMELEKLPKKVTRPPPHRLPTQLLINKTLRTSVRLMGQPSLATQLLQ